MDFRRFSLFRCASLLAIPLALILGAAAPVAALDQGPYSMEILVNGRSLAEYATRGTTYIEATDGSEYSIRLRNHTDRRIAVALSVDGLNSIDAKTTSARAAAKWILQPYETVTLEGWQTGSDTARRFFFTTEEESYGAWLGKTDNLGVITAAVFREKVRFVPIDRPHSKREAGRDAPAPAESGERSSAGESKRAPEAELSDDHAATGIGREVDHRVHRVRFEAESSPTAVMQLRYEYHDALVKLGVLPRPYAYRENPLDRRERARGFDDIDFAPDPYRLRR